MEKKKIEKENDNVSSEYLEALKVLIESYKVTGDVGKLFPLVKKIKEELKKFF